MDILITMLIILVASVGVIIVSSTPLLVKRTCRQAFGQGYLDAYQRSWDDIKSLYLLYIDKEQFYYAACYQSGLQYAIEDGAENDPAKMKKFFNTVYASGNITKDANLIAIDKGSLAYLYEAVGIMEVGLMDKLNKNTDLPIMDHILFEQLVKARSEKVA